MIAISLYVTLAAALAVYHGGIGFGTGKATAQVQADPATLCDAAVTQSQEGGLILDRSDPNRVSVDAAMWKQLPDRARQALGYCLGALRPASSTQAPVEIVEVERR